MERREPPYHQPEIAPGLRSGRLGRSPIEVRRAADLVVLREDRIDFGKDESGSSFEYVYRFASYEILARGRPLAARRYADTWGEAAIFFEELPPDSAIPYDDEAFATAARYFFGLADIDEVKAFLKSGYQVVDRGRCTDP